MADSTSLQCHFNWNLIDNNQPNDYYENILENLQIDINMNPDIEIPSLLFMSFLSNHLDDTSERAIPLLNQALEKCTSYSNQSHAIGFKIVALGIKFHLVVKADDKIEITKLSDELNNLNLSLNDVAESAIYGTRGYALSMTHRDRYGESLSYYQKAFRLDRHFYEWPMAIANMAGRLRRIQEGKSNPSKLEEEMFKLAIDLSDGKKALPIVFMADVYFAKGRVLNERQADKELLEKSKRLYLKAYEMMPNSSQVLKRCGKAFTVMDDIDLAKECLKRAIRLNPFDSICLHRLGQVYEHKTNKLPKAKEYYERAIAAQVIRNVFAELDLARVNLRLDKSYDLMEHYRKMELSYKNNELALKHIDTSIKNQTDFMERMRKRQRNAPISNRGRSSNDENWRR